jgi:hypothetical protein
MQMCWSPITCNMRKFDYLPWQQYYFYILPDQWVLYLFKGTSITCNMSKFDYLPWQQYYFYILPDQWVLYLFKGTFDNLLLILLVPEQSHVILYTILVITHPRISTQFLCEQLLVYHLLCNSNTFISFLWTYKVWLFAFNFTSIVPTYYCNISWCFRLWPLIPVEYQVIRITATFIMV